jgi:hypothetical protein
VERTVLSETKEPSMTLTQEPPTAGVAANGRKDAAGSGTEGSGDASTNVLIQLPARLRRAIYICYGLLALAGTATTAYFGALPNVAAPEWVTGGLAALGALAAPISVLAATNVRQD